MMFGDTFFFTLCMTILLAASLYFIWSQINRLDGLLLHERNMLLNHVAEFKLFLKMYHDEKLASQKPQQDSPQQEFKSIPLIQPTTEIEVLRQEEESSPEFTQVAPPLIESMEIESVSHTADVKAIPSTFSMMTANDIRKFAVDRGLYDASQVKKISKKDLIQQLSAAPTSDVLAEMSQ